MRHSSNSYLSWRKRTCLRVIFCRILACWAVAQWAFIPQCLLRHLGQFNEHRSCSRNFIGSRLITVIMNWSYSFCVEVGANEIRSSWLNWLNARCERYFASAFLSDLDGMWLRKCSTTRGHTWWTPRLKEYLLQRKSPEHERLKHTSLTFFSELQQVLTPGLQQSKSCTECFNAKPIEKSQ